MNHPLIGITSGYRTIQLKYLHTCLSRRYTQALVQAGSIPLIIPANLPKDQWDEMMNRVDGILLSGGDDVNPNRYGEEQRPETKKILDERDEFEIHLMNHALENRKPLFGICRGLQLINVGLGGNLYQHILDQHTGAIQHDRHDDLRDSRHHEVSLDQASRLRKIIGRTTIRVNTLHHQGIKTLGKDLVPSGRCSEDNLIEAIEIKDHPFFVAVQWHPEELIDHPEQTAIFRAFIEASSRK